jgi:6-phosphogluconolactonase
MRARPRREIVVGDPHSFLADELGARLERRGRRALARRGRFAVALSGGSVAAAFFPLLARRSFDWRNVDFFWCDERAVPPEHEDSNYGLARRLWLDPAGVPAARIHRMEAERPDLAGAAIAYSDRLVEVLGRPARLDVVLLGVGPDGHVASLFPEHAALVEHQHAVLPIADSPKPPPRRLTLSVSAIAAARLVVVAAFGAAKAPVMHEALHDSASRLPVAIMARLARRVLFLLDEEAVGAYRVSGD